MLNGRMIGWLPYSISGQVADQLRMMKVRGFENVSAKKDSWDEGDVIYVMVDFVGECNDSGQELLNMIGDLI